MINSSNLCWYFTSKFYQWHIKWVQVVFDRCNNCTALAFTNKAQLCQCHSCRVTDLGGVWCPSKLDSFQEHARTILRKVSLQRNVLIINHHNLHCCIMIVSMYNQWFTMIPTHQQLSLVQSLPSPRLQWTMPDHWNRKHSCSTPLQRRPADLYLQDFWMEPQQIDHFWDHCLNALTPGLDLQNQHLDHHAEPSQVETIMAINGSDFTQH